ncbi:MAG: 2-phospho-L-lactate guanylyltransferase [Thermomicrobiales bacterium]|nr:2-phospho-L-lactate guanylyltransferase [Thermomicrobiales bacterium]
MTVCAVEHPARSGRCSTSLRLFALLPFRGLANPKSRLSTQLSETERSALALGLLNRAIAAVAGAGIERVAVITRDPALQAAGLDSRAEVLLQETEGLNAAVRQGQRWALAGAADGLLILLPDLPVLEVSDIRALVDAASLDSAVIAPDRHGTGTNALLLAPPDAIAPAFGLGSAGRHRRSLALADVPVTDIERRGTHLDLDTPDDYRTLETTVGTASCSDGVSNVNHHSSGV